MALETRAINSGAGLTIKGLDFNNTDQFVQAVNQLSDAADFGGSANGTSLQQIFNQKNTTGLAASTFNCDGRSKVIFKTEFSNSTATVTFRLWLKDYNATPAWRVTNDITPSNKGTAPVGISPLQAGYSHGVGFSIDTEGAKEIYVQIVSISTPGTDAVSLWACGV